MLAHGRGQWSVEMGMLSFPEMTPCNASEGGGACIGPLQRSFLHLKSSHWTKYTLALMSEGGPKSSELTHSQWMHNVEKKKDTIRRELTIILNSELIEAAVV